jgi:Xaa-Pro aminopeptidase
VTRIERAAAAASEAGLTGLLAAPGPDLLYLTGYSPTEAAERLILLVAAAGRDPVLLLPGFERGGAEGVDVEFVEWSDGEDPYALAAGLLEPGGRYAISDACWALHVLALQEALPGGSFASMTAALPLLRAVKDAEELERMAAAGAAADATFADIVAMPFAGRRELDVAEDLARFLLSHGHSSADFTIVGSGPNGANPHHGAGSRVIAQGDAVVLDFGGTLDGYGSDTTRTVHVGEPSAEHLRVHEVVRAAQQAGFEAVQPGMCFSIEPGIYVPGEFGVRIEDIVTVTEDGGRRLNDSPREPQIVG